MSSTKTFVVSYLNKYEMLVLNVVIEASSITDAIAEVKEDAVVILSAIPIKTLE